MNCYLVGLECTIKYLLLHRGRLLREGPGVRERISRLFGRFAIFLLAETWRARSARQRVFVLALKGCELPHLVRTAREDPRLKGLVPDVVVDAFKTSIDTLLRGSVAQATSRGSTSLRLPVAPDLRNAFVELRDVAVNLGGGLTLSQGRTLVPNGEPTGQSVIPGTAPADPSENGK